jgi:hypothetical protein
MEPVRYRPPLLSHLLAGSSALLPSSVLLGSIEAQFYCLRQGQKRYENSHLPVRA